MKQYQRDEFVYADHLIHTVCTTSYAFPALGAGCKAFVRQVHSELFKYLNSTQIGELRAIHDVKHRLRRFEAGVYSNSSSIASGIDIYAPHMLSPPPPPPLSSNTSSLQPRA